MKDKKCWKWLLFIVVLALVGWYTKDSMREIFCQVAKTPWYIVGISSVLALVYFLLEGQIIARMARKYVPDFTCFYGIECAFYCDFYRYVTLGSGTFIAEIYYLYTKGIDTPKATGMSMVQYVYKKISIALMGVVGFISLLIFQEYRIQRYDQYLIFGCSLTVVVVVGIILVGTSKKISDFLLFCGRKCTKKWTKLNAKIDKIEEKIQILQQETKELVTNRQGMGILFLLNILKMSCWYLIPYVLFYQSGILTLGEAFALTAINYMIAGVMPAPAGIGTIEFVFMMLFKEYTTVTLAGSALLVFRFVICVLPFLIGACCVIKHSYKKGQG